MRMFQKAKNNYKNNRGLFWELESRIMGGKENNVLRPTGDGYAECCQELHSLPKQVSVETTEALQGLYATGYLFPRKPGPSGTNFRHKQAPLMSARVVNRIPAEELVS